MNLRDVLRQSEYAALTDAECVTHLAGTVEITRDAAPKNVRDIQAALEPSLDDFRLVWGTFEAAAQQDPAMRAYMTTLSSTGVNFTNATLRGIIATLATAGSWPDAVRDKVLALGIVTGPRWQASGLEEAPDEADVAAARARNDAELKATTRFNLVMAGLDSGSVADWDDALAIFNQE